MEVGTLQIERISAELRTRRIGRRIEYLNSTTSTNDEAWQRIEEDTADGLVILAEYQTAGRGRLGRVWHSPRGASLLCSVALIDRLESRSDKVASRSCRVGELTGGEIGLLAAVAARDAIVCCSDVIPIIKWPNDLLVAGRKLGGVLIESRVRRDSSRACVLGIGINCLQQTGHLPPELADSATSLELESDRVVDRTALVIALLAELDGWLTSDQRRLNGHIRAAWLARCEPMGQRIRLQHGGRVYSGSVVDIDPDAALIVRLDEGGVRAFSAAHTTIIRGTSTASG